MRRFSLAEPGVKGAGQEEHGGEVRNCLSETPEKEQIEVSRSVWTGHPGGHSGSRQISRRWRRGFVVSCARSGTMEDWQTTQQTRGQAVSGGTKKTGSLCLDDNQVNRPQASPVNAVATAQRSGVEVGQPRARQTIALCTTLGQRCGHPRGPWALFSRAQQQPGGGEQQQQQQQQQW